LTKINNIKNFSLLLVLSAVITVTLTTPNDSFAVITGGTVTGGSSFTAGGTFNLVTPPIPSPSGNCAVNSVGNNCQQTHDLWGFDEDQNIVLVAPLTVDDSTGDGIPDGAILPIGTTVASHYVYYDPQPRGSTIVGCVQFDSPVVATIFSRSRLAASDFLANTGVNYLNPTLRGFELANDIATFSGSEVCVSFRASTPGDYFRVLTEFSPETEPRTIGFWKNHPDETEEHLPIMIGDLVVANSEEANEVFNVNARNAHDMLAAQLLAAEINVWNNIPSCDDVDDAISDAQLELAGYTGPDTTTAPENGDKAAVNAIKDVLDNFNNNGCS